MRIEIVIIIKIIAEIVTTQTRMLATWRKKQAWLSIPRLSLTAQAS